jgi:hypothetical protein
MYVVLNASILAIFFGGGGKNFPKIVTMTLIFSPQIARHPDGSLRIRYKGTAINIPVKNRKTFSQHFRMNTSRYDRYFT